MEYVNSEINLLNTLSTCLKIFFSCFTLIQLSGNGFWERVGGYCSSGTGDDASSLGHTPSSWSLNFRDIPWESTNGVQCCYFVSTWILWASKCFRFAWHWWAGMYGFLSTFNVFFFTSLQRAEQILIYAAWLFPLLRQLVPNVLLDCVYPGPSSCSGEWNAP